MVSRQCVQEYNNTVHSVTNYSPHHLLNGSKPPIVPLELDITSDLEADRLETHMNTLQNHNKNETKYYKNKINNEFKVGDLIYVENRKELNRHKLAEVGIGAFPIIQKLSKTIYKVACGLKEYQKKLFHISNVKLYEYDFTFARHPVA